MIRFFASFCIGQISHQQHKGKAVDRILMNIIPNIFLNVLLKKMLGRWDPADMNGFQ